MPELFCLEFSQQIWILDLEESWKFLILLDKIVIQTHEKLVKTKFESLEA